MNPTRAEFPASPDHSAVSPLDGQPLLTNYQLDVMQAVPQTGPGPLTAGALMFSFNLGKPTPDAANLIAVSVPPLVTMTANVKAVATITAIGPGGSERSPLSNPFGRAGAPRATGAPAVK